MTDNAIDAAVTPIRIGLLLTDGFALMSYAAIVEPFRAANRLAGKALYEWTPLSIGGLRVNASGGTSVAPQPADGTAPGFDWIFVFAGGDPRTFRDPRCFAWLRRMARLGATLAGVSGGPFLLARAGLLNGCRATIHWEHAEALRQEFPNLDIEGGLYIIDGKRITCAGGTAGMDLAVELIERDHGAQLARQVSEWFIRTQPRSAELLQRASAQARYGTADQRLVRMLTAMENAIDEPLAREDIARKAGLSLRQLERLCAARLKHTMSEIYMGIRLDHAEQLLRSTSLSATDVGLASGFRSLSHFSRRYRQRFGAPPGVNRNGGSR